MRLKGMLLASVAGATGFAAIGPANASGMNGLYTSVFGGLNWQKDYRAHRSSFIPSSTHSSFNIHAHSNTGFVFGIALGYDLSEVAMKGLRVELEGSYRRNSLHGSFTKTVTNGSTGSSASAHSGDAVTWAVMANAWYDIDIGSSLKPYIGGGVGWARNKFTPKGFTAFNSVSEDNFAWQLGAGLNWQFQPYASIGLGYRYMDSGNEGPYKTYLGNSVSLGDVTHNDVIVSISFAVN